MATRPCIRCAFRVWCVMCRVCDGMGVLGGRVVSVAAQQASMHRHTDLCEVQQPRCPCLLPLPSLFLCLPPYLHLPPPTPLTMSPSLYTSKRMVSYWPQGPSLWRQCRAP